MDDFSFLFFRSPSLSISRPCPTNYSFVSSVIFRGGTSTEFLIKHKLAQVTSTLRTTYWLTHYLRRGNSKKENKLYFVVFSFSFSIFQKSHLLPMPGRNCKSETCN